MQIEIKSLAELRIFAGNLQKKAGKKKLANKIFALIGELGAGKTTFAKFFLKAAGIKQRVTSPTFVLMVPYKKGRLTFYHLDLYRTKNFKEIEALGLPELWNNKNNIFLIEWADKIKRHLPQNTTYLKFKIPTGSGKKIKNAKIKPAKGEALPNRARQNHRIIEILKAPKKLQNVLK
jgi:tRNA threonylcarbamoyladenosine biosynthesis protein TsaE